MNYHREPRQWDKIPTTASTAYEVILRVDGGETYVLGYTARVSKQGLAVVVGSAHELVKTLLDLEGSYNVTGGGRRCEIEFLGKVTAVVRFSGRTEREAAGAIARGED